MGEGVKSGVCMAPDGGGTRWKLGRDSRRGGGGRRESGGERLSICLAPLVHPACLALEGQGARLHTFLITRHPPFPLVL